MRMEESVLALSVSVLSALSLSLSLSPTPRGALPPLSLLPLVNRSSIARSPLPLLPFLQSVTPVLVHRRDCRGRRAEMALPVGLNALDDATIILMAQHRPDLLDSLAIQHYLLSELPQVHRKAGKYNSIHMACALMVNLSQSSFVLFNTFF